MLRCLLWVIAAAIRPKVLLVADNLCLRQQLLVLPQAAAAPHGCGPAFLDSGVSVVRQLSNLSAHRKARNRAALAPAGVAELLASAFKPERQDGPPPNCARTAHPDPADDHGEPSLGPVKDPGGVGAAGVQSLRKNDVQTITFRTLYVFFVIHHA